MIHHATAETAEDIARLLRSRGRIIVTAPARSGKTTELLRYAESRYPNGRFAFVCSNPGKDSYVIKLHWCLYNELSFTDVVAKRLLGEDLEGEDINPPMILIPNMLSPVNFDKMINPHTPIFCDDYHLLSAQAQSTICRRKLFIAATMTGESNGTEED
jgi:hypothetical protein